jgi:hypothetical protein
VPLLYAAESGASALSLASQECRAVGTRNRLVLGDRQVRAKPYAEAENDPPNVARKSWGSLRIGRASKHLGVGR